MTDRSPAPPAPRFFADVMLGRLARWLRVLGYDTAYETDIDDPDLVERADAEGRVLLTRDRHLVTHLRPERSVLVQSDVPLEQLREVVDACDLEPPGELFTRCPVCNGALRPATETERRDLVPDDARDLPGPIRRCPRCGRVYWLGSHTKRMRQTLAAAFPEWSL